MPELRRAGKSCLLLLEQEHLQEEQAIDFGENYYMFLHLNEAVRNKDRSEKIIKIND